MCYCVSTEHTHTYTHREKKHVKVEWVGFSDVCVVWWWGGSATVQWCMMGSVYWSCYWPDPPTSSSCLWTSCFSYSYSLTWRQKKTLTTASREIARNHMHCPSNRSWMLVAGPVLGSDVRHRSRKRSESWKWNPTGTHPHLSESACLQATRQLMQLCSESKDAQ